LTAAERSGSSAIREFLAREIDLGSFPGASWAVGKGTEILEEDALGHAVSVPLRLDATPETIYDCASLTKPLVTTTLVLQAVAEGRIALDQEYHGFTYRELLTHTTGLRAWLPLYAFDDYLMAALEHGPEIPRGSDVIYSDLNFIILWCALHEIYGDFVQAARSRIFEPLGLRDAYLLPPATLKPRIAAAEWGQRWERKMCDERRIVCGHMREGLIWGETHDGNSHYAGGTAGNAGLFATAREVFRLARGWPSLLPHELAELATRNLTPGMSDGRGLGWQKPTGSEATKMLSPAAFGHTGFTGTSVWVDGDHTFVLLTNRVHPCAAPVAMQRIRGEFHRLCTAGFQPAVPAPSRRR
jgi:CubicO group peptidase (beta-lactamase class C family)